jgi:hypothetical protein
VTRGDDARGDDLDEVADGVIDPLLHRCASEVVATKDDVDRQPRGQLSRRERGVHDSGMRTCRQYRHSAAPYVGSEQSLVEDQRIRFASVGAEREVSDETCLVLSNSLYLAAADEESCDEVRLAV